LHVYEIEVTTFPFWLGVIDNSSVILAPRISVKINHECW